jgi:NAD(P)-dependent dehydrogenase (short-subunit alcohol dehydrogenase family)
MTTPRTAIVTGAASGIGLAIAERLGQEGHRIALFDIDRARVEQAAQLMTSSGVVALGCGVDVTDRAAIEAAVADLEAQLGPPTILVNNAGLPGNKPFLEITLEEWNARLEVNLTGTFHLCQVAIPHMLDAGWGRIVNISSSSTHSGVPRMTHYVAAKSGVNGFSKSLAKEFARFGITVNVIPPGFIDTPMLRAAEAEGSIDFQASLAATPVGRAGEPEDIAAACAFLVSEEASYITGQMLGVNGGRNT